jgi:hypothetical protein
VTGANNPFGIGAAITEPDTTCKRA